MRSTERSSPLKLPEERIDLMVKVLKEAPLMAMEITSNDTLQVVPNLEVDEVLPNEDTITIPESDEIDPTMSIIDEIECPLEDTVISLLVLTQWFLIIICLTLEMIDMPLTPEVDVISETQEILMEEDETIETTEEEVMLLVTLLWTTTTREALTLWIDTEEIWTDVLEAEIEPIRTDRATLVNGTTLGQTSELVKIPMNVKITDAMLNEMNEDKLTRTQLQKEERINTTPLTLRADLG